MDTPSSESESYDRSRRREAYRRPGNRDRGRAGGSGDEDRTADISDKLHILANTLQVLRLCKSRLRSGCKAFENVVLLPSDCWPMHHFTPQDTSRNLTKVDQTLGQYRNYAGSQAEAMAQVHLHHPCPSHWAKSTLFQPLLMIRTFSPYVLSCTACMLQLGGNLMEVINHFQTQMLGRSTGVQNASPSSLHSSDLESGVWN